MWLAVIVSSIVGGVIATTVMLPLFHFPRLLGGRGFDVIGALGSAFTGELNTRARTLGASMFYLGGVVFAMIYGLVAYALMVFDLREGAPPGEVSWALPFDMTFAFPVFGLAIGMAHGGVVALMLTILVVEHHPVETFRRGVDLVFPSLLTHPVFGVVVMLVHRWVLYAWAAS